ncbi:MAG: GerMN domain-containing protein [Acidobacteria bacterium]|nr:GerMN domain-containing protein [Acidobacteriota bacterium]
MTTRARWIVGAALAAALVGVGSWMLVRSIVGRTPAVSTNSAVTAGTAVPGERRIKVTLFYVAEDGLRLSPVERDVPFAEGPGEQARRIIEAQLAPPPAPLLAAIPNGTTLRGLYVTERGEAFVDFDDAIRSAHPGGSLYELFTVYSIVSALTVNLPAITSVQILVDGHEVDTLAGHVDLRRPLPRSALWLEPPPVAAAR